MGPPHPRLPSWGRVKAAESTFVPVQQLVNLDAALALHRIMLSERLHTITVILAVVASGG